MLGKGHSGNRLVGVHWVKSAVDNTIQQIDLIGGIRFRKARALLFYLLHAPGVDHRGEKIADIFWQDYSHDKAMASLRQTIRQVRSQLPENSDMALVTRRGHLGLRWGDEGPVDRRMCALIAETSWPARTVESIERYVQEFDLLIGLSDSFDSWMAIKKSQTLQSLSGELEKIFGSDAAQTDVSDLALQAAKVARQIEPANEAAARFLMRQDWMNNAANRAIETYNALYHYLDSELDQEPEAETIALAAAVKAGPYSVQKAAPDQPDKHHIRPTIVLLKTEDETQTTMDQSLLTVLFHDMKMRLSRFREWRVVDDEGTEQADIWIALKLLAFPSGSKLSVEVTKGAEKELIWAEMIPAPTTDWDSKARAQLVHIARSLSIATHRDAAPIREAAVYDKWLESQMLIDMWSPTTEAAAIQMLDDITKEAPRFGAAHAELAGALNVRHILLPGTQQTGAEKQRALHHALEAITLDPLDTRAHRVLAWCYCHKDEFELAGFHFEQALALNESNSLTLASCALGCAFSNRIEEAERLAVEMQQAPEALEPFHLVYLAAVNYLCGHYEQTAHQCDEAGDLMATVGGWHVASLVQLGQMRAAKARLKDYHSFMMQQWVLPKAPSCQDVIDWFVSVFPLRDEAVREELRSTLLSAAEA